MIDICFSKDNVECINASEPVDVEIILVTILL